MTTPRLLLRWVLGLLVVVLATWFTSSGPRLDPAPSAATTQLTWSTLPPGGQGIGKLIAQGGPFQYEKDGTVFGNRERLLPPHKRGYYREYTVPTPGLNHRGARRVVCGGLRAQDPQECYYSDDHYSSFRQIQGPLPQ